MTRPARDDHRAQHDRPALSSEPIRRDDSDPPLVDRDPLAVIDNLKSIALVMKNGRIIDESRLNLPNGPAR